MHFLISCALKRLVSVVRHKRRGRRAEYDLVELLQRAGYKARRVPASVGPDAFATRGNQLLAFEVKTTRRTRVRIPPRQIAKLFAFLDLFDYYPRRTAVVAVRFPRKWVFLKMKEVPARAVIVTPETTSTWQPEGRLARWLRETKH